MHDFKTVTMTEQQIAAIMKQLDSDYRLLTDSAGLFSLYVRMPDGTSAETLLKKFWEAYGSSQPTTTGVARPFDARNVRFLSAERIASDAYLEDLFDQPQEPIELPAPHLQHWIQPNQMSTRAERQSTGPHRIAFYSYKGGVGRSTTMALAALTLASQGKNVLLVDFDLEAPGLASMLLKGSETPRLGLVDYLCEWPALRNRRDMGGDQLALHRQRLKQYFLGEPEMNLDGTVYVLPAGRVDYDYPEKLAYANVAQIERMQSGANPIEALFSDLAAEIKDLHYILIDSRTGIADIGGSLLFRYADVVCACFYDDKQNREGLELLAQYILRRTPDQQPKVCWVHTKSPAQDPAVHEELTKFLEGVYQREHQKAMPHLHQIVEHEALRRVDRSKFDDMPKEKREQILADLNILLEAIKREVNDHD